MFTDTINKCAANAARIARLSANNPLGFWVSSAMAGAYVGLGIILIFTLGNLLDPSVRPLVMGATFGIALTLVIIAGSELFTGHTMFLTLGVKAGTISHGQMWAILPQTWLGNLVGSVFVALLYSWGGGSLLPVDTSIVHSVALAKTTAPATVLFFKGALCNWLVCLAIWMAIRTEGTAKFLAIWWCLLAFIASGYEHSVANMTLFALSGLVITATPIPCPESDTIYYGSLWAILCPASCSWDWVIGMLRRNRSVLFRKKPTKLRLQPTIKG